jgi:hypothetical protein
VIDYKKLPDYLSPDELRRYFEDILRQIETQPEVDQSYIIDALWELADRQWHTYTLIAPDLAERIEAFIEGVWVQLCDRQDSHLVGKVLSIIGNLGLKRSYEMIKKFSGRYHSQTGQRIDEFIQQVEVLDNGKIEDPYYSLKKNK